MIKKFKYFSAVNFFTIFAHQNSGSGSALTEIAGFGSGSAVKFKTKADPHPIVYFSVPSISGNVCLVTGTSTGTTNTVQRRYRRRLRRVPYLRMKLYLCGTLSHACRVLYRDTCIVHYIVRYMNKLVQLMKAVAFNYSHGHTGT